MSPRSVPTEPSPVADVWREVTAAANEGAAASVAAAESALDDVIELLGYHGFDQSKIGELRGTTALLRSQRAEFLDAAVRARESRS